MGIGAAIGGIASGIGAIAGGGGGGGGGSSPVQQTSQGIGDILSGGLSAALGIQGLSGANLSQLQSGAAAANPFGQYAGGFVPALQQLLGSGPGSITANANAAHGSEVGLLQSILSNNATINTGAAG